MIILKNFFLKFKIYFIFLGFILFLIFFLSLLNTLGVSKSITNIISIICSILLFIVIGYSSGKKCEKKGYIEGIKQGFILILILMVLGLITFTFSFKTVLYYAILILSSTFGAMLGINQKK